METRKNIIVVEDEFLIAYNLKVVLEKMDYNPIINIASVQDAIDAIEKYDPILVLIDINLNKDQDGITLGHYLLEKDSIPYIYITSYSNETTINKASETRPHGYIVKPFKPSDISTIVTIVLHNYYHKKIDTQRSEEPNSDYIPFKMKEVIHYINNNIDRRIELKKLVALTKWDRRHFGRIFKQYLDTTPYQYILNKKIDKSKALLKDSDIPITQIAYDIGFEGHSNFCAAFKKIVSITPEQFRKKYQ
jgi:AraC-like DNA-binding protein